MAPLPAVLRSLDTRLKGVALLIALLISSVGCKEEERRSWTPPPPSASEKLAAKSPDRLPPGELLEGPDEVYGFRIPKGMKRIRRLGKHERMVGAVNFDELTDYVRARIVARHAEMIDGALVFPTARIKGVPETIFEFTLREEHGKCTLEIVDRTPPRPTQGLSEKQRWERTGLTPSGELIDPQQME